MAAAASSEFPLTPSKVIDSHVHVSPTPINIHTSQAKSRCCEEMTISCFSVLKKYPCKFVGCLLANPADDGSGIKHLEELVLKMTNEVGKALFAKAGDLGVPVGFMCMKGINVHFTEIEELCSEFPSTPVIIDHVGFCKPPENVTESESFSDLLKLSKFPQIDI